MSRFCHLTSDKLKGILKQSELSSDWTWDAISEGRELLTANHTIGKAELLFSKIEDKDVQFQLDKLEASKKANEAANKKVEPQKGNH